MAERLPYITIYPVIVPPSSLSSSSHITTKLERYGSSSQLSEHCIPHSRNLWSAPVCSRYLEHTDWMRARWLLLWHRDDVGGPNNAEDAGDDGPVAGDAGEASGDAGSRERASGEE